MRIWLITGLVILLSYANVAYAYDPGTHGKMAIQAVLQSNIKDVCNDIGLDCVSQKYPDSQVSQTIDLLPNNDSTLYTADASETITDLVYTGAVLEDEFPRSLFHFYDPVPGHLDPLNIDGIPSPYSDPVWALGGPLVIGQSYSLNNANDYFYKALTSSKEDDRNQDIGNLFLTLGHAIHLLQDMAQPQHVRNDMHCDADICKNGEAAISSIFGVNVPLYNPSLYEAYTYVHANVAGYSGGYVPVKLNTARSYWNDTNNDGIAQYTNENFVSAGSNFNLDSNGDPLPNSQYSLPIPTSLSGSESIDAVYQELGEATPTQVRDYCALFTATYCSVRFAANNVIDSYTGGTSEVNGRAASYSIFDQDLESYASQKLFTLNGLNFQYDWMFLIPRAVGYSGGLINYFFRGRIDVQPDPNKPGWYLITNKSTCSDKSTCTMSGTFALYYDDTSGNRILIQDWKNINLAAPGNDPGDQYSFNFSPPTDPAPANPGQYMMIFQGKIGTEDGVAGKLVKLTPHYLYTSTTHVCESVNDCATVWSLTDNLDFSTIQPIDNIISAASVFPIYKMAVYDGKDYVISQQFDPYPASYHYPPGAGCADSLVAIQSVTIADFPCWGEPITTYLDGIALNTNNLYVSGTDYPGDIGNIYVYDHNGNYLNELVNMPASDLWSLSANDSRLCLSGWTNGGTISGTVLTDLNGNVVASWPGDPDFGGGPCTLTKDRVYVLAWCDLCNATLNVYDLNGNQISSLAIPNSLYVDNITATDSNIYISAACESIGENCSGYGVVMVFDRTVTYNSSGQIESEQLIREPDVAVPWVGPYTSSSTFWNYDLTVDVKDILSSSGGQ